MVGRCVALLLLGLCSCSVVRHQGEANSAYGSETVGVRATYIPVFYVKDDVDSDEIGGGSLCHPDLNDGQGAGLATFWSLGDVELRAEYTRTEHDEKRGGVVDIHHGHLSFWHGIKLIDTEALTLVPRYGVGVGGVVIDFDQDFKDAGGATALLGGEIEVRLMRHVSFHAGIHAFLWGYPGETIGRGALVVLGGSVRF